MIKACRDLAIRPGWCACGKPLHYLDPQEEEYVESLVIELGPMVKVKVLDGRCYWVQRHFIALHGLKGWEIPEQGWEEVIRAD